MNMYIMFADNATPLRSPLNPNFVRIPNLSFKTYVICQIYIYIRIYCPFWRGGLLHSLTLRANLPRPPCHVIFTNPYQKFKSHKALCVL